MSGGVDSSVAAYLLKKQGYDVIGVTMQIWQEEDEFVQEENGGCCGLSAVDDARRVAQMIGIPHYVMNFRKDFKDKAITVFLCVSTFITGTFFSFLGFDSLFFFLKIIVPFLSYLVFTRPAPIKCFCQYELVKSAYPIGSPA